MERKVGAIQENTLQTLGSVSQWDELVRNEKLTKEVVMPEPTSYPLATVSVNKQSYMDRSWCDVSCDGSITTKTVIVWAGIVSSS